MESAHDIATKITTSQPSHKPLGLDVASTSKKTKVLSAKSARRWKQKLKSSTVSRSYMDDHKSTVEEALRMYEESKKAQISELQESIGNCRSQLVDRMMETYFDKVICEAEISKLEEAKKDAVQNLRQNTLTEQQLAASAQLKQEDSRLKKNPVDANPIASSYEEDSISRVWNNQRLQVILNRSR